MVGPGEHIKRKGRKAELVRRQFTSWSLCSDTDRFHALEKEMATHSSVLAWRIPGTGEPGGLLSMGSHRVGHDWSDLAAAAAAGNHSPLPDPWEVYLEHRPSSIIWLKKAQSRQRNWYGTGQQSTERTLIIQQSTPVNSFLGRNEFNSRCIIDGPRSPKLVDSVNIILYLWVGYIMQGTKQALNLSSFQKFQVLILLTIFSLQIYRETHCYHSGVQADGGSILTPASIITRAVLREDSCKERKGDTHDFHSHTMEGKVFSHFQL